MKITTKEINKIIKEELAKLLKEQESFADMDSLRTGQKKGISLGGGGLEMDSDLASFKPSSGNDGQRRRRRRRFDEPRRADRGGKFVRPQQGNPSSVAAAVRSWNPYPDRDAMELHPEEEQYARKRFDGLKRILSKLLVNSLTDSLYSSGENMIQILGLDIEEHWFQKKEIPARWTWGRAAIYASALSYMSQTNPDFFGEDVLDYIKGLHSSKYGKKYLSDHYSKYSDDEGRRAFRRHVKNMNSVFSPQSAQGSDN